LVAGLVLALAAPIFAWIYDAPVLIGLLLVVAVTLPLGAASTVLRAKLRVELRFQTVAIIAIGWYLLRSGGTIVMAALGMGLMSIVVPLVIVALYEWAADYYATRMKPWRKAAEVHLWPGLLGKSFWVVSMGASRGLARTGDYLVLPLLLSKAVVGPYYFGYQLTTQIVELLATNLQHVLFPALSRITNEPERQSRAILLTIRMLVFVAAPVSLGLAVTIGPLVEILDSTIWRNKWSVAIPLMQIFAVAAPLRMFSDIVTASLSAQGNFRGSATLMLAEGIWLMASAGLAVAIFGADITGIALVVAVAQAIFSMSASVFILRRFDIGAGAFFGAFAGTWLTSVAAAALAAGAIHLLAGDAAPIVRLATGAAVFTVAFIAMARILLRGNVDELIRVAPRRAAKVLQRVLLLPDPESST
jgi:PST family polysaccharide transporter